MQQARRTKLSWQNLGNIAEFNAAIEENHETFSQDNLCTGKYVPNVSEEFLHVREVILFCRYIGKSRRSVTVCSQQFVAAELG